MAEKTLIEWLSEVDQAAKKQGYSWSDISQQVEDHLGIEDPTSLSEEDLNLPVKMYTHPELYQSSPDKEMMRRASLSPAERFAEEELTSAPIEGRSPAFDPAAGLGPDAFDATFPEAAQIHSPTGYESQLRSPVEVPYAGDLGVRELARQEALGLRQQSDYIPSIRRGLEQSERELSQQEEDKDGIDLGWANAFWAPLKAAIRLPSWGAGGVKASGDLVRSRIDPAIDAKRVSFGKKDPLDKGVAAGQAGAYDTAMALAGLPSFGGVRASLRHVPQDWKGKRIPLDFQVYTREGGYQDADDALRAAAFDESKLKDMKEGLRGAGMQELDPEDLRAQDVEDTLFNKSFKDAKAANDILMATREANDLGPVAQEAFNALSDLGEIATALYELGTYGLGLDTDPFNPVREAETAFDMGVSMVSGAAADVDDIVQDLGRKASAQPIVTFLTVMPMLRAGVAAGAMSKTVAANARKFVGRYGKLYDNLMNAASKSGVLGGAAQAAKMAWSGAKKFEDAASTALIAPAAKLAGKAAKPFVRALNPLSESATSPAAEALLDKTVNQRQNVVDAAVEILAERLDREGLSPEDLAPVMPRPGEGPASIRFDEIESAEAPVQQFEGDAPGDLTPHERLIPPNEVHLHQKAEGWPEGHSPIEYWDLAREEVLRGKRMSYGAMVEETPGPGTQGREYKVVVLPEEIAAAERRGVTTTQHDGVSFVRDQDGNVVLVPTRPGIKVTPLWEEGSRLRGITEEGGLQSPYTTNPTGSRASAVTARGSLAYDLTYGGYKDFIEGHAGRPRLARREGSEYTESYGQSATDLYDSEARRRAMLKRDIPESRKRQRLKEQRRREGELGEEAAGFDDAERIRRTAHLDPSVTGDARWLTQSQLDAIRSEAPRVAGEPVIPDKAPPLEAAFDIPLQKYVLKDADGNVVRQVEPEPAVQPDMPEPDAAPKQPERLDPETEAALDRALIEQMPLRPEVEPTGQGSLAEYKPKEKWASTVDGIRNQKTVPKKGKEGYALKGMDLPLNLVGKGQRIKALLTHIKNSGGDDFSAVKPTKSRSESFEAYFDRAKQIEERFNRARLSSKGRREGLSPKEREGVIDAEIDRKTQDPPGDWETRALVERLKKRLSPSWKKQRKEYLSEKLDTLPDASLSRLLEEEVYIKSTEDLVRWFEAESQRVDADNYIRGIREERAEKPFIQDGRKVRSPTRLTGRRQADGPDADAPVEPEAGKAEADTPTDSGPIRQRESGLFYAPKKGRSLEPGVEAAKKAAKEAGVKIAKEKEEAIKARKEGRTNEDMQELRDKIYEDSERIGWDYANEATRMEVERSYKFLDELKKDPEAVTSDAPAVMEESARLEAIDLIDAAPDSKKLRAIKKHLESMNTLSNHKYSWLIRTFGDIAGGKTKKSSLLERGTDAVLSKAMKKELEKTGSELAWADGVADALAWQQRSIDLQKDVGWGNSLTRMWKKGRVIRDLGGVVNAAVANWFVEAATEGNFTAPVKALNRLKKYRDWEKSPGSRDRNSLEGVFHESARQNRLAASDIHTAEIDLAINALREEPKTATGKVLRKASEAVDKAYSVAQIEKTWKNIDKSYKLSRAWTGFNRIHSDFSKMKVGDSAIVTTGRKKSYKISKGPDGWTIDGKNVGRTVNGRPPRKVERIIADSAAFDANSKYFDYRKRSRAQIFLQDPKLNWLVSPFYSWTHYALTAPGKEGLAGAMLRSEPTVKYSSPSLQASQNVRKALAATRVLLSIQGAQNDMSNTPNIDPSAAKWSATDPALLYKDGKGTVMSRSLKSFAPATTIGEQLGVLAWISQNAAYAFGAELSEEDIMEMKEEEYANLSEEEIGKAVRAANLMRDLKPMDKLLSLGGIEGGPLHDLMSPLLKSGVPDGEKFLTNILDMAITAMAGGATSDFVNAIIGMAEPESKFSKRMSKSLRIAGEKEGEAFDKDTDERFFLSTMFNIGAQVVGEEEAINARFIRNFKHRYRKEHIEPIKDKIKRREDRGLDTSELESSLERAKEMMEIGATQLEMQRSK